MNLAKIYKIKGETIVQFIVRCGLLRMDVSSQESREDLIQWHKSWPKTTRVNLRKI